VSYLRFWMSQLQLWYAFYLGGAVSFCFTICIWFLSCIVRYWFQTYFCYPFWNEISVTGLRIWSLCWSTVLRFGSSRTEKWNRFCLGNLFLPYVLDSVVSLWFRCGASRPIFFEFRLTGFSMVSVISTVLCRIETNISVAGLTCVSASTCFYMI
jgi:hypothetical protein